MHLPVIVLSLLLLAVPCRAIVLHAGDILVIGESERCGWVRSLIRIEPVSGDQTCVFPLDAHILEFGPDGDLIAVTPSGVLRIDLASGEQTVLHSSSFVSLVLDSYSRGYWAWDYIFLPIRLPQP